jgi:hypothetical protein
MVNASASDRALRVIIGVLALGAASAGCLAYNEDCSPLVDNPDEVVGYLGVDIDITKAAVRTQPNLMGSLIAESYLSSTPDNTPSADVGIENSGAIRSDGICENHDVLPTGPLLKKTLREVLPFDDSIAVVTVSPQVLKQTFEHSVATLVASSAQANTPSGDFLQIAGAEVHVDCLQPAENGSTPGQRVQFIRLVRTDRTDPDNWVEVDAGVLYDNTDGGDRYLSDAGVRLAADSFLVGDGGSDFASLADLPPSANEVSESGLNFQIVSRWFEKTYSSTQKLGSKSFKPPGGWVMPTCQH